MTNFKTRKKDKQVFPVGGGKEYRRKDDYKDEWHDITSKWAPENTTKFASDKYPNQQIFVRRYVIHGLDKKTHVYWEWHRITVKKNGDYDQEIDSGLKCKTKKQAFYEATTTNKQPLPKKSSSKEQKKNMIEKKYPGKKVVADEYDANDNLLFVESEDSKDYDELAEYWVDKEGRVHGESGRGEL